MTTLKDAPEVRTTDAAVTLIKAETDKIDEASIDGLLGVENSLAYRVSEIEKHFHNREFSLGEHETRSLEDDCGQRDGLAPFQVDAGDGTQGDYTPGWGTPLCVVGRNDVPITSDGVKYNLHGIVVVDVESTADLKLHKTQIVYGRETFAEALADLQVIDVPPFIPLRGGAFTVVEIKMPRVLCGADKVWVRHWVDGVNTGTMDFFVGLHEYPQFATAIPTTTTTTTTTTTSTTSSSSSTSSTASTTSSTSSTASTTSSTSSTASTTSSTSSTASTTSSTSSTASTTTTSSTTTTTTTTSSSTTTTTGP